MHTHLRPPITYKNSHGILTMCPSSAVLTIPLGPTNPSPTNVERETLFFRRAGFSPALWLLVPTFLLPNAPAWVTPSPSAQIGILSYRSFLPKKKETLSFGTMLSPVNLRCKISYWVSCYAFFKRWLLLSQLPQCLGNFTSLSALSMNLGTLNRDQGCFPFDHRSLAPGV